MTGFQHRLLWITLSGSLMCGSSAGVLAAPTAADGSPSSQAPPARQSIAHLQTRAENGDANAQNQLGEMYMTGESVDENKQAAILWFRKSARQGNAEAMCNLAAAYYDGAGVATDDSLSLAWFLAAQKAGCARATDAVQRAESQLPPRTVAKAYQLPAEMYANGEDLPKDQAEAARWWQKAATGGDADTKAEAAVIFLQGKGVPLNVPLGHRLCQDLEDTHDSRGAYCLGYIYQHGIGATADAAKARKLYGRAAQDRYFPAMKALAEMEASGQGGKIDQVSACVLYADLAARRQRGALQSLAAIKRQMPPKQWKKVESQLRDRRIDPKKLDEALQQLSSP
jgi:uncharacterized protein